MSLDAIPAQAAWPPLPNGHVPICEGPGEQLAPVSAPDGSGGAIIAWTESGNGTADVYAQRVDGSGALRWPACGIAVSAAPDMQAVAAAAADGAGGAFVVWADDGDLGRLHAQRVDASGALLWPQEVVVGGGPGRQMETSACADGSGGVLVAWAEPHRSESDTASAGYPDIYAMRLDRSGRRLWADGGVALCTTDDWQIWPKIVPDGSGGAIVAWSDGRGEGDIYAQRVTAGGRVAWTAGGVPLGSGPGYQLYHDACSDGSGGAIVAWSDGRGPTVYDVYAQRIDAAGTALWGDNGLGACTAPGSQAMPVVTADGAGGAIIAFQGDRTTGGQEIRAQHVASGGELLWSNEGISLALASGYQAAPCILTDGEGGAFVTWQDDRNSRTTGWDLYGQHVSGHGDLLWLSEGGPVVMGRGAPSSVAMVSDGGKGAIVSWALFDQYSYDVSAQHIGEIRPPAPPEDHAAGLVLVARPNPAPEGATLRFTLPREAEAALVVHDQQGRRLRSLMRGRLPAGEHDWSWDGRDDQGRLLPSGVYFVVLEAGGERQTRRIALIH